MTKYAAQTKVPPSRTRDEINSTLKRFGASQFKYYEDDERAVIGFVAEGREVQIALPLLGDRQEVASRWRTLALAIKAKLSLIECGGSTFEREFFAHLVLPSGLTVHEAYGQHPEFMERDGVLPPIEAKVIELPQRASS